jgi:cytochrome c peroxidase
MGCANCHVPRLGDVDALYSDLLLHDMGNALAGGGSYFESSESPKSTEWRTPPLWGVADSAPYLHDGRAPTLEAAIRMHGGRGTEARERFAQASPSEQKRLLAFLRTLRAPASAKPDLSRMQALIHSSTHATPAGLRDDKVGPARDALESRRDH